MKRMKTTKKQIILIFLIIMALCILAYTVVWFFRNKERSDRASKQTDYIIEKGVASNIDDVQYYVVQNKDEISQLKVKNLSYEYLTTSQFYTEYFDFFDKKPYLIYNFIDPISGAVIHSFSFKEAVPQGKECYAGYFSYRTSQDASMYLYGDKKIYALNITIDREDGYLYYDLDDKTVKLIMENQDDEADLYIFLKKGFQTVRNDKRVQQNIMTNESFLKTNKLNEELCFVGERWDSGGYIYVIRVSDIPSNNEKFNMEFPDLKDIKDELDEGYVVFRFPYDIEVDTIVQLLNADGSKTSYDNIYIDKKNSIDGEEHYVNSYDEYLQYIDKEHPQMTWYIDGWYDEENDSKDSD